jgi:regulator of nucleoside diphosphate kinase
MMMTMQSSEHVVRGLKPPRITLSAADYDRLSALVHAARRRLPDLAADLGAELARAYVLARGREPEHIVRMNSAVEFRDHNTGKIHNVFLVYPEDADISQRRISVLTPVGTALIGLRTGASIKWETPGGQTRQLTVLGVRDPAPG